MYSLSILEEELKNRVGTDFFADYDTTRIIGKIDFAVAIRQDYSQSALFDTEYLLWAEAKKGNKENIYHSLVQLILTIGKARTFDHHLPPLFLGAFDAEKIAFVPYHDVMNIFYQNDFNWNVTPSNHATKEFAQVLQIVTDILNKNAYIFPFSPQKELQQFIKQNFVAGRTHVAPIRITKNNFIAIYQKWEKEVKPTIGLKWEEAKKQNVLSADFFLADILSNNNLTLKEKLRVLLKSNRYEMDRKMDYLGAINNTIVEFTDQQVAHTQFWNRYRRPKRSTGIIW